MENTRINLARGYHPCILLWVTLAITIPDAFAGSDFERGLSPVRIGPNFRIYPSAVTQTEPFITRDPGDPSVLFSSANTINLTSGFVSEGIYVSTDAGTSWRGSDTCNGAPITFHGGDPGIAIDKDGVYIIIRLGTFPTGIYSHFSTDAGLTWSSQRTITTGDQDRANLVSDTRLSSANYGRSYAVWVEFAPPYPVKYTYTDNGASSWSAPLYLTGTLFLLGSVCWLWIDPARPVSD